MSGAPEERGLGELLGEKIKTLHDSIWERRADWPLVEAWLDQFGDSSAEEERIQALYLLSNFMYFGTNEIRALLKSLFRDVFRASVIAERRRLTPALTMADAASAFNEELARTRFVSLGNPSESSAFLLYYFRQENDIPRECFISGAEIFSHASPTQLSLRNPDVTRYVFIDDMCGSGKQGEEYSENTVVPLKTLNSAAKVYYYALFGTSLGIGRLRALNRFDRIHPVVELDGSFRCFHESSRIYKSAPAPLDRERAAEIARKWGLLLQPEHPLGYRDGQLLLGFAYNTPDNTLPIIWSAGSQDLPWSPMFKRYSKLSYG